MLLIVVVALLRADECVYMCACNTLVTASELLEFWLLPLHRWQPETCTASKFLCFCTVAVGSPIVAVSLLFAINAQMTTVAHVASVCFSEKI